MTLKSDIKFKEKLTYGFKYGLCDEIDLKESMEGIRKV